MKRIVVLMLGIVCGLAEQSQALSVGDIVVRSHRGEPLKAEVRYFLEPQERGKGIDVRIGTATDYRAEDLTRPSVVDRLTTALVKDGQDLIRLTSDTPLEQETFSLLLLVRAGHLTIVRHYQVALKAPTDPPVIFATATPHKPLPTVPEPSGPRLTVATPPRKAAPPAATELSPVKEVVKTAPNPTPSLKPGATATPQRYGPVQHGATLYGIAREIRVPNNRLWQSVVLLWRANQEKFTRGNLHGLQAGSYLEVPANLLSQLDTLTTAAAQQVIDQHWQAWRNKQNSPLSPDAPATPAPVPPTPPIAPPQVATPALTIGRRQAQETIEPPSSAMAVPSGTTPSLVSVSDLQDLLQGLEERIAQRLNPIQEPRPVVSFVSASELQTTVKNLEDRLTQQVEHVLAQYGLAVPAASGQTLSIAPAAARQPQNALGATSSGSWFPYVLLVINGLFLLGGSLLLWTWWRYLGDDERRAILASWRARLSLRRSNIVRYSARRDE